jgi:hypothetical protein
MVAGGATEAMVRHDGVSGLSDSAGLYIQTVKSLGDLVIHCLHILLIAY